MSKIKVLVVPSDRTGVSYYRSTIPHIKLLYNIYRDHRFLRFKWIKILALYSITTLFTLGANYFYTNIIQQHQRDRFEVLVWVEEPHFENILQTPSDH